MGYDVHKLVDGRALVIGGVDIPFEKGCSAIRRRCINPRCDGCTAGAAGLDDIGKHFPDTDERYRGIPV